MMNDPEKPVIIPAEDPKRQIFEPNRLNLGCFSKNKALPKRIGSIPGRLPSARHGRIGAYVRFVE